ncbi:MAG TPA: DUF2092 domain-containing protein [Kofleriaceae bacterium]
MAGVVLGAAAPVSADTPDVDPKADALLQRMSSDLAALKTFSVDTQNSTEVVTQQGEKVAMLAGSTVSAERPNKLRTDRAGAHADMTFFYDGRNVTIWGKRANLYATAQAPPTLDQTIDFVRDKLDIDAPAADLLGSNPYQALMEDVVSGKYIADEPIGDRMCHHLAYRGHETDWQIWIADGPQALPCRFEITSKTVPGQPEYVVTLTNWRINPPLPANEFVFTPPRGSARIDFLDASQRAQDLRKEPK